MVTPQHQDAPHYTPGSEKNASAFQTQLLTRKPAFQICYKMEMKESCMASEFSKTRPTSNLSFFLSYPNILLPTHGRCRGLQLRLITFIDTHTLGSSSLDEGSAHRRDSTWQYTTLTRDRHSCLRRDKNPQSQQMSGRRPSP